jgi:hypothetical protein
MRRTLLPIAALAAAVALALPAAAPAAKPGTVKTKLSIDGFESLFSGVVSSTVRQCVGLRRVRLWKVQPGPDKRIAKTTTRKGSGQWNIASGQGPGGVFYATVSRVRVTSGGEPVICSAARSKNLR